VREGKGILLFECMLMMRVKSRKESKWVAEEKREVFKGVSQRKVGN
jgi:hypothetical protein